MFNIETLTKIVTDSLNTTQSARDQTLTLVIGQTGVGKSTTINYLMRYPMKEDEDTGSLVPDDPTLPMPCDAKDSATSVTITPAAVKLSENIMLCDCPGFGDNRSDEIRVAVSVCTEAVVRYARHIRGLIVVLDWHTILQGRGEGLREAALSIGALIRQDAEVDLSSSVMFVLTKGPEKKIAQLKKKIEGNIASLESNIGDLQNKLQELSITGAGLALMDNPLGKFLLKEENRASLETDAMQDHHKKTIEEKTSVLFILKLLKNQLDNHKVVNCNVLDEGPSRDQIINTIASLSIIPKEAFNFGHADPTRRKFTEDTRRHLVHASHNIQRVSQLRNEIEEKRQNKEKLSSDMEEFIKQKEDIDIGKVELGEKNPMTIRNREILRENREKISSLEEELSQVTQEIEKDEYDLRQLDVPDEMLFEKIVFNQSRLEVVVQNTALSAGLGIIGAAMLADDQERALPTKVLGGIIGGIIGSGFGIAAMIPMAVGTAVYRITHEFEYKGEPFTRVEEQGFSFSRKTYLPEEGRYISKYKSGRALDGDAIVTIFGEKRHFAQNKTQIEVLQHGLIAKREQKNSFEQEMSRIQETNRSLERLIDACMNEDKLSLEQQKHHLEALIVSQRESIDAIYAEEISKEWEYTTIIDQLTRQRTFFEMIITLSEFIRFNSASYPKLVDTIRCHVYPDSRASFIVGRAAFYPSTNSDSKKSFVQAVDRVMTMQRPK